MERDLAGEYIDSLRDRIVKLEADVEFYRTLYFNTINPPVIVADTVGDFKAVNTRRPWTVIKAEAEKKLVPKKSEIG